MKNGKKKSFVKSVKRARFSIDEGFAEKPIYSVKAFTTEKDKGIDMVNLIKDNFDITSEDIDYAFKRKMEDWQNDITPDEVTIKKSSATIKWTRDERGNIVSPFSKKLTDQEKNLSD